LVVWLFVYAESYTQYSSAWIGKISVNWLQK
jgi:hypothetical protein